jgi:hypothetical protein
MGNLIKDKTTIHPDYVLISNRGKVYHRDAGDIWEIVEFWDGRSDFLDWRNTECGISELYNCVELSSIEEKKAIEQDLRKCKRCYR